MAALQTVMFVILVAGMLLFSIGGMSSIKPENFSSMFAGGGSGFVMAIALASKLIAVFVLMYNQSVGAIATFKARKKMPELYTNASIKFKPFWQ